MEQGGGARLRERELLCLDGRTEDIEESRERLAHREELARMTARHLPFRLEDLSLFSRTHRKHWGKPGR